MHEGDQGMLRYIEAEDADLLILTETKCADPKIKELEERYSVSLGLLLASLS